MEIYDIGNRRRLPIDWDVSMPLTAKMGTDGGNVPVIVDPIQPANPADIALLLNDQGGEVLTIEEGDASPTLRAHTKHHEPIVLLTGGETDNPPQQAQ